MERRLTHCSVPGHGTRCVVAQERGRDGHYRSTEERRALEFEFAAWADESLEWATATLGVQLETWPRR